MAFDITMNGESLDTEPTGFVVELSTNAIREPISYEMNAFVSIPEHGVDISVDQFVSDNVKYVQKPRGDEWIKEDMSEEMLLEQEQEWNLKEQLILFQQISESISMSEREDTYVLEIEGTNEEFKELIRSHMLTNEDIVPDPEVQMLMENFEIEHMTYILQINKETFHQETVSMNVVAASEEGDMSMEIVIVFESNPCMMK